MTALPLVRRWAMDWLNRHDPGVCADILEPDYFLRIGTTTLHTREDYVAGTVGQLARFPGLVLTVHEVIGTDEQVAVRFTEHGASPRDGGAAAAWAGIALHRCTGTRLCATYAEEDYFSRRRQLRTNRCDPIEPPAPAPWDTPTAGPDTAAESVVRDWLARGLPVAGLDITVDDGWTGHPVPEVVETEETTVETLFSAGPAVAFHCVVSGRYRGNLEAAFEDRIGDAVRLNVAGLVHVGDQGLDRGRLIRDRLGLVRQLRPPGRSRPDRFPS